MTRHSIPYGSMLHLLLLEVIDVFDALEVSEALTDLQKVFQGCYIVQKDELENGSLKLCVFVG